MFEAFQSDITYLNVVNELTQLWTWSISKKMVGVLIKKMMLQTATALTSQVFTHGGKIDTSLHASVA